MTAAPRRVLFSGLALCLLAAGVLYALAPTRITYAPCGSCDARHKHRAALAAQEITP